MIHRLVYGLLSTLEYTLSLLTSQSTAFFNEAVDTRDGAFPVQSRDSY